MKTTIWHAADEFVFADTLPRHHGEIEFSFVDQRVWHKGRFEFSAPWERSVKGRIITPTPGPGVLVTPSTARELLWRYPRPVAPLNLGNARSVDTYGPAPEARRVEPPFPEPISVGWFAEPQQQRMPRMFYETTIGNLAYQNGFREHSIVHSQGRQQMVELLRAVLNEFAADFCVDAVKFDAAANDFLKSK